MPPAPGFIKGGNGGDEGKSAWGGCVRLAMGITSVPPSAFGAGGGVLEEAGPKGAGLGLWAGPGFDAW